MICYRGALVSLSGGNRQDSQTLCLPVWRLVQTSLSDLKASWFGGSPHAGRHRTPSLYAGLVMAQNQQSASAFFLPNNHQPLVLNSLSTSTFIWVHANVSDPRLYDQSTSGHFSRGLDVCCAAESSRCNGSSCPAGVRLFLAIDQVARDKS